jgi:protocatechuate 3,4-dioxygenase beta subunit
MMVGWLLLFASDHAVGMGRPNKWEQMQQAAKKLDVPIVFYGIVTDDGGAPVSNAQVEINYAHFALKYGGGIDPKEVTTDEAGRFTVSGIRGREIYLNKIYKFGSCLSG